MPVSNRFGMSHASSSLFGGSRVSAPAGATTPPAYKQKGSAWIQESGATRIINGGVGKWVTPFIYFAPLKRSSGVRIADRL
jgi:hypothetical protein